jgi:hypothetical protein
MDLVTVRAELHQVQEILLGGLVADRDVVR